MRVSLRCLVGLHRWRCEFSRWFCVRCGKFAKTCNNCGRQHNPNAYAVTCTVRSDGSWESREVS